MAKLNASLRSGVRPTIGRVAGLYEIYIKRLIDLMVSVPFILFTMPLGAIVAVAIKLDSPGPVLFRQKRVGYQGRPFTVIKFRSMVVTAEENGPQWACADDARITRVGSFLRKVRFDELPQLLNVLRGEMSLIGPRPEQLELVEMLQENIPGFGLRHKVKPGITGLAQVEVGYAASIEESRRKFEYDMRYIRSMGLVTDLQILLKTAWVLLSRRGAR